MGFGNFLKGTLAQVNPFDKGKTFGSYNQKKKKKQDEQGSPSTISVGVAKPTQQVSVESQAPKPKKTPNIFETLNDGLTLNKPNPLVSVAKSQDTKPVPAPKPGMVVAPAKPTSRISGVTTAPDQGIKVGNDTVRRTPGAEVKKADPNIVSKNTSRLKKIVATPLLSGSRVGTGIIQGGAGLYDLATPGKGQNRVTQATTRQAEALDAKAKELGVNNAYRTINVPMEIASSLAGAPTKAAKAPAIVQKITKLIGKGGRTRKIASQIAKETLDPQNIAQEARLTARYTGQDSARGKAITPEYIAQNVATSLAGTAAPAIIRNMRRIPEPPTFSIRPLSGPVADIGNLLSDNAVRDINTVNVPIRQNIPVVNQDIPQQIPIRNMNQPRPLIREFPGDASIATPDGAAADQVAQIRQAAAAAKVPTDVRPDRRVEGVTPQTFQDLTGVSRKSIKDERLALDEALANKEINKTQHKAANKALDEILLVDKAPTGRPISIKQVDGIPVTDQTIVPTGLPETPGTVRVTSQSSPMADKSEAVANAPVVAAPPRLPKVGTVLPDGTKVTKRMVQAQRNQVKNAKAYAKAQEQVAEQTERIRLNAKAKEEVLTPEERARREELNGGQSDEFASTGNFRRGAKGDAYESVNRVSEERLGRQEMATRSVEDLVDELSGKSKIAPGDQRRIEQAMKNLAEADPDNYRKDPLWNLLNNKNISNRRKAAQILALGNRTIRKSATSDTLSNRWRSKVTRVVDGSKVSDVDLKNVQKANDSFVEARDNAARLAEQYKRTGSKADLDAFEAAQKAAEKADIEAKTAEVTAAKNTFKGTRSENGAQVINDLEKEAELNMMDATTASQLSGPATGMRNLYGTELAGIENRLFGNIRAKITNNIFGENVGGYSREGARAGRKEGFSRMRGDAKRRAEYSGLNPLKRARSFATTMNSFGESSLYSQKQSRLYKYYENKLKANGLTGEKLKNDTRFLSLTDPDNMGDQFMDAAMKSSGLTGIYQKSRQIELQLAQSIADKLDNVLPPGASNAIAKGITRVALGYPTATGNFIVQSGRRATLGLPSLGEVGWKLARGDKTGAAQAFDRFLKEAGGGAAGIGAGMALANAGLVTGFYPEDEDERQRWADEGKSELSINIGGTWHPIPQGFGMFGLPLIVGATLENDGADEVANILTDKEKMFSLLPADQLYGVMKIAAGGSTENQDKSFVASTIRSLIPAGSFLNQTAKGLDQTANDTTTKDFWSNVMDQVISGIPGHQAVVDIPDKVSSTGEPIKNPNLLQTYLGARSVEQPSGIENSQKVDAAINKAVEGIDQYGLLTDKNMEGVLEGKGLEALTKLKAGKQLDESDVKALKEGLVKGVSSEGTDTAYLEREQYDTNLSVLKLKKQLMEADKTVKPSDIKKVDMSIKRGEIYKSAQVPYDLISSYQDVGIDDWRKMGDPEDDNYDPEMYQRLWDIDQTMAKSGVSYKKGAPDKNKYYVKQSKASGTGKSSSYSSDFGTLKASNFAPSVKSYDTIDQKSGGVPIIRVARPNIVHRIGTG